MLSEADKDREYKASISAGVIGHLGKASAELASALQRLDTTPHTAMIMADMRQNLLEMQEEITRRLRIVAGEDQERPAEPKVHLIVAGERRHFDAWVADNPIPPGDRYVYCNRRQDVEGFRRDVVIHLVAPGYRETAAFEALAERGMVPR